MLLILAAAAWIARSLEAQRREPSPWLDDQALLTRLARLAEPVDQLVPEGEALRYVEPLDERGQPLARDNALCYWHALLAPRRLGHAIDSRYLLVRHGNPANPRPLPGLESARLLAELGEGFQLVEKRP